MLKTNIKAAGGGSQTADAVLTSAAGQRGLEQTTKVALNEIAGTWKTRAQASGWHAALLDVPPKIARPPRLSAAEAKAAEYRQIATDEWRKGDFAFGWPGYPERREFEASTMNTESGTVSVLRAFTYEQWLSFRTGQLQSTGQAR